MSKAGLRVAVCAAAIHVALPAGVLAQPIGLVRSTEGTVTLQRGPESLPGAVGVALQRGDVVRTGRPGAAGLVLSDDTTISLGPGSELALDDYAFEPRDGRFALGLRMLRGTFSYITGQITRLSPDAAKLRTPDATIAVRGTKVLIQVEE